MSQLERIVFASGNRGKAREVQAVLGDFAELVLQTELGVESIEETGATFAANALLKARHAAEVTGLPALADDSGLAVAALDGAPGVYSARYAGSHATDAANVAKLLAALEAVPEGHRDASFHCVLAFVRSADDADPVLVKGEWQGRIAFAASGEKGFGYDPIFFDPETNCTAAELEPVVKNARSHRGKALAALQATLAAGG
jgi:XTP/dITP diphosphohydrolase